MDNDMREIATNIGNNIEFVKLPTSNIQIQSKSQLPNPCQPKGMEKSQKKTKIYDLRERLIVFSKRILQICNRLPKIPECEGIRKQLSNAGTSIGANFEEADGALTKRDFINKTGIARKEAKETKYWLKAVSNTYISEREIVSDIKESEEIISILSSILKNSGHKVRY